MDQHWQRTPWSMQAALHPVLSLVLAIVYALFLLAYPPRRRYRKPSIVLLALPVTYAFTRHLDVAPSETLCDVFGRFLYIWLAHMSFEVVILEFEPKVVVVKGKGGGGGGGWKSRVRQAYSVLFDRNHRRAEREHDEHKGRPVRHGLSRTRFVRYHVCKAATFYVAQAAWDMYLDSMALTRSVDYTPEKAYFFRRLTSTPSSLDTRELYFRLELTFDWCIVDLLFFESYYSVFAVLFVSILRLDSPQEWSLSLCGSLAEAWSVRRYWGKHWHNYIYHSFSAHIKVVSRDWLGFERGRWSTRLLENSLVFFASGLMHSLVRWQQEPDSDIWCITIWYAAQMLPIVVEGVVQNVWRKTRQRLGVRANDKRVDDMEKAVGYAWVTGWFMWTVPKYLHTRNAWTLEIIKRKYAAVYEEMEKGMGNFTE